VFLRDNRKRIVVIDDHALVRQGLERLLNLGNEFVVSEEAGNAAEGIETVREMRPDAVIVDVGLPDGPDGIELTEKLRKEFPSLVILILSAHEEPEYARRAAKAGAMGYVLKSEDVESLRTALRNAFNGKLTFSEEVLKELG
jgi:DNA-binding NarL/FixJ family response regulator